MSLPLSLDPGAMDQVPDRSEVAVHRAPGLRLVPGKLPRKQLSHNERRLCGFLPTMNLHADSSQENILDGLCHLRANGVDRLRANGDAALAQRLQELRVLLGP